MQYHFDVHWTAYGSTSLTVFSKEVTDSPIVEDNVKISVGVGISYRF